jgi:ABC-type branched-subunit amino acid transport system ATPase component
MLNVAKLNAYYGKKQVLFGIDLTLGDGRIAAVIDGFARGIRARSAARGRDPPGRQ